MKFVGEWLNSGTEEVRKVGALFCIPYLSQLMRLWYLSHKRKVGRLKPPPVLTGGFNRLKPPQSVLPKVVNTGQYWSIENFSG